MCVFDGADSAFNIAEGYKKYLELRIQATMMYLKAVNGKKHYYTRAKIKELEADAILGVGSEQSYETACAMLSKKMGFAVRANEVTVAEFYGYIEIKA